jgi:glycosyltransferase involved in cell wall biosynthesis
MNILCIDQYGDLGGAQRMLLELLPWFSARGWNPYVASPDGSGSFLCKVREMGYGAGSFEFGRYSKIRKPATEMVRYLRESYHLAKQLSHWIHALAIDLVYVNGPRVLPPASLAARRSSIPLVFHCHNRLHQRSAACLAATSLRLAGAQMIACCRYATEPLRSYIKNEFVHVIYNGVAAAAGTALDGNTSVTRIGVIGRIEEEKGQFEFVHAARLLSAPYPELRFSVFGKPLFADETYFERVRAASEGLPIEFRGWVDKIADAFGSLDLLVVPSTSLDATPRIILEALAAGVPIVAYAVGGIPELLTHMQTGILVKDRTPRALADGIAAAIRMSPEERRTITQNGKRLWQDHFRPEAYGNNICRVISQMVTAP